MPGYIYGKRRHPWVIVPDVPPEVDAAIDREHNSYQPVTPITTTPPACGTDRAYRHHLKRGEHIDDDCREAHRAEGRKHQRAYTKRKAA